MKTRSFLFNLPNIKYTVFFLLFILFFIKSVVVLDPDLGWHIRLGSFILNSGIPTSDPFSYSMPSFPYIDHEWLSNLILFKLHEFGGEILLAIISSLVTVIALLLRINSKETSYFLIYALSCVSLLSFVGIRVQVIGWLFFSLLLIILAIGEQRKKATLLFLLFLAWANMHGSFPLGLIVLIIYQLSDYLYKKSSLFYAGLTIIGSFLVTFLNPYGIRIYIESITTIADRSLPGIISEWTPLWSTLNISILVYLIIAVISYFQFLTIRNKGTTLIFLLLFVFSIVSIRHFPFFLLFSLPSTIQAINLLKEKANTHPLGKIRFKKGYLIFTMLISLGLLLQIIIISKESLALSEERYYPSKSVTIPKLQVSNQRIFVPYNWGGYILWKAPKSKVFIDGRMPSWKNPLNHSNESPNAFVEYQKIIKGEYLLDKVISKYGITSFILPSSQTGEFINLHTQLIKLGWQVVYVDSISIVYLKN